MSRQMDFATALRIFQLHSLDRQTEDSVKKIYKKLAKQTHPDSGGNTQDFVELQQAYTLLLQKLQEPFFTENPRQDDHTSKNGHHNQADLQQQLKQCQAAYAHATHTIDRYETILNNQVNQINAVRSEINTLYTAYQQSKNIIIEEYNQAMITLDRARGLSLKNILLGTISNEEYLRRKNAFILRHNEQLEAVENDFIKQLLNIYQTNLDNLVQTLNV